MEHDNPNRRSGKDQLLNSCAHGTSIRELVALCSQKYLCNSSLAQAAEYSSAQQVLETSEIGA